MLGTSFGLARMKIEASQAKGSKFGMFTTRQGVHESSTLPSITSREPFMSRQHVKDSFCHDSSLPSRVVTVKSYNFSDLSSFIVLRITSSTDVWIEWLKFLWKDNSEYYNFHEDTFLRKCRLNGRKYPWTCYICLNSDSWRWNGTFLSSWV